MKGGFVEGFRSGLQPRRKRKKRRGSRLTERERKVLIAIGDKYGL